MRLCNEEKVALLSQSENRTSGSAITSHLETLLLPTFSLVAPLETLPYVPRANVVISCGTADREPSL
jgi:hypothetical protein